MILDPLSARSAIPINVREPVCALREILRPLLREAIQRPSLSGDEGGFVRFIEDWAREQGFTVESWETDEATLAGYPQTQLRHLPLAGRPTLLVRLPGRGNGRSLLFNAHSDVVAPGDLRAWRYDPWAAAEKSDKIYGRGAADVKGPLAGALWAMGALRSLAPEGLDGDVMLELVPGEEDCVGLGTLTSVAHGVRAAGTIVLEPTEGLPCCASRGGCRFAIECRGRAVHGTVKWLGCDAIALVRRVLEALETLESRWNDHSIDPLFSTYPIARPITVDSVKGGEWQGMVCDVCRCEGYLELLPGDGLAAWQARFERELREAVAPALATCGGDLTITFSEQYQGHMTPPDDPFCELAAQVAQSMLNQSNTFQYAGFNSGCEAGLRANLHGTPTLVWGPGSLAQAHAPDEFIELAEIENVAAMFAAFAVRWCGSKGNSAHETLHNS